MRSAIVAGVVAATTVVLAASSARADDAPSGIEVGLRSGYAIPLGDAVGGNPSVSLGDQFNGAIPIWVDAGYRLLSPNLFLGAYFQYGIGLVNSGKQAGCSQSGVSCSGNILMYGIQAHYHLMPDQQIDPWVGLGVGLENANTSVSGGGQSVSGSANGIDFATIMVGADYKVMPSLGVGPFINFALGQYSSVSSGGNSKDIQDKAMHEWLTFGVRGVYDISL